MHPRTTEKAALVVVLAASACAFSTLAARYWPFTVDDAFITFRYAKHLAEGLGPAWNPGGERAEGYTSALWVAVMSVPHAVGVDARVASKLVGIACALGATAMAARLTAKLTAGEPREARLFGVTVTTAALLFDPRTAVHAVSGMETALAALLLTAFFALAATEPEALDGRRRRALAALALVLPLARPEAALPVAITASICVARAPRGTRWAFARTLLVGAALPGAAYFAARAAWFGMWLPLPFYVKAANKPLFAGAPEVLTYLRDLVVERPYFGAPIAAAVLAWRRLLAAPLAGAAALLAFFVVPEHVMGFDGRYLAPLTPFAYALVGAGAARIASKIRAQGASSPAPSLLGAPSLAAAGVLALALLPGVSASIRGKVAYGRGIEEAHVALGRALRAATSAVAHPRVAMLDAGATPYVSEWEAIDTFGLNDRTIARRGVHDPADVLDRAPSVVVVVSRSKATFDPQFAWEQALYDEARRRGFVLARTYAFAPDYHLWVMVEGGGALGARIASAP